ncbi:MAG: 2-oxo acid dehydrogenase subunit E2 [Xanthomonadaceae bacterium]|nr:2-oxo acid dehydrogenase subunit E2 [Xanthomonadaceae bacterium]
MKRMKTFKLPDLGEGLPEAEIVTWHVKVGDSVKVDQPLLSVETAKAVVDVPSPWTGTIKKLHGAEGDMIPTHAALVDFDVDGEATAAAAEMADTTPPEDAPRKAVKEDSGTVVGNMPTSDEVLEETAIVGRGRRGKAPVKAAPSARALAKELGVDIGRCAPSGRSGVVTAKDVRAASSPSQRPAPSDWQPAAKRDDINYGQPEKLRGPRRAMHQSMSASRDQVMPCTLFDDADIHGWMPGQDITARVIRAIVAGCRAEPCLNAWYDGEQQSRILHEQVDLAMAVDTPDGLIVPVLRGVDRLDGGGLRAAINDIKVSTRDRTVTPAQMKDATITLSNFGMMAGRYATPVVVPPQVAIVGTGGIRHDVVPVLGGIETHRRIPLSLTFDHRCITGGEGCRFLAAMIADLQKPF